MIIIADSGSTKTHWCILSETGRSYFTTAGLNPFFTVEAQLPVTIRSLVASHLDASAVTALFFYGAGCQGDKIAVMEKAFRQVFPNAASIQVRVDLLAAARALLGDTPGFAAILGTGTNSCIYDGNAIAHHIDSLGFLLGDEGSGAAIGKQILIDFLRNQLPGPLRAAFVREYGGDEDALISLLYKSPQPNRFCAGYAKFLDVADMDPNYREAVIHRHFRIFFSQLVCLYPEYETYRFNCVGSIAHRFKEALQVEASHQGMEMGIILPTVIEELASYHWDRR